MALYQDKLISEIQKVCKKGQSVENFVNNWIRSGESFDSLYQFLITRGVQTNKNSVWRTFRPMLTLPYSYKDQFFYKWNAIAKTKGFVTAEQMITSWEEQKYTQKQIADELGLFASNVGPVIKAILDGGESFKAVRDLKHAKAQDEDGFSRRDFIEAWDEKLKKMGYENLRQAIEEMKSEGLNYSEMGRSLGISPRAFRWRRRRIREQEEDNNESHNLSRGNTISAEAEGKKIVKQITQGVRIQRPPEGDQGAIKSVTLKAKVPWDKLSNIVSGVIRPLKDKGVPPEITIEIKGESEEGFDRDTLDNKVRETLHQIGATIEKWEEG